MATSRRRPIGRLADLFGKLRPRKRPAPDPNSLLVDQRSAHPPQKTHGRGGSYIPPPDPGNLS